jgi:hypothetical protein
MLMAAIIPLLTTLSQKRPRSHSHSRPRSPSTPHRAKLASLPLLPLPRHGSELRACLSDFLAASGLDFTDCKDSLMEQELTPDIIPDIAFDHLCTITGAVEGRIQKFQAYCKLWNAHLDTKKEEYAEKKRRIE